MTGGLGNQMFIYAFYMKMKRLFPNTRIDLSDMMHYHVHNGYELHRIFQQLPEDEFCMPQKTKKVIEFLFCVPSSNAACGRWSISRASTKTSAISKTSKTKCVALSPSTPRSATKRLCVCSAR